MRTMSKIIMFLTMALALTFSAMAQNSNKQKPSREQLAEIQAQHIAHDLAMDDATRQKFIDTYCAQQKEIWAIGPRPKTENQLNMSEEETEKAIKERFEHSQQLLAIRQKYYQKYSTFLTQKQIQRVYEVEKQMMERLAAKHHTLPNHPLNKTNASHKQTDIK